MTNKIELFLKEFKKLIEECAKFFYITRDIEFQQETIKKLTKLKNKASTIKKQKIEVKDENGANTILSLENLINGMINELEMWIALKENTPNKAWDLLINAQCAVRRALQAHDVAIDFDAEGYLRKLIVLEKLLFPPQIFTSTAFLVESAQCSICGKEYGECEHVVGKPYMGKICYRKIIKCKHIDHVAFVDNPADKRTRTTEITMNGLTRNFMTWKIIKKDEKNTADTQFKAILNSPF